MSAFEEFIAHCKDNGDIQSVSRHLLDVSVLVRLFAEKIGLGSAGEVVGLLHDLGKYSPEFRRTYCRRSDYWTRTKMTTT